MHCIFYLLTIYGTFEITMMMYSNGEIQIIDGEIPSYLQYNVMERVDFLDIKINLSISRMEGTIFYFIDKTQKQVIVSLYGDDEEKLKFKFNGQEKYLLLSDECGCQKCRYIPLMFQVEFNGHFFFRCNGRKGFNLNFTKSEYNKDYPVLNDENQHSATIYFINTPEHNNKHPNSEQLYGCIFEILVNNKSVNFTKVGVKTVDKCQNTCSKNICNSGICFETYDTNHVCDCTNSFGNGDNCNEDGHSIKEGYLKSVKGQEFKFKYLKISWNSTSSEIFKTTNTKNEISIKANGTKLTFRYIYSNGVISTIKGTVTDKYNSSSKSILVLTFEDRFIKYQYIENGVTKTFGEFQIANYLEKETFSSMVLLNNGGLIDVAYKMSTMDYIWNRVQITYPNQSIPSRNNFIQSKGKENYAFLRQRTLKSNKNGGNVCTFEYFSTPKMVSERKNSTLTQRKYESKSSSWKRKNSTLTQRKYESKSSSWKIYFIVTLVVTNIITLSLIIYVYFRKTTRRNNPMELEQKKILKI